MAHYAFLDENSIVTEVIVGKDEGNGVDWEEYYGNIRKQTCKRTSYNTLANEHKLGGTAYRGNYASIGYTYDDTNDVFIAPKPADNYTLNTETWTWEEDE
jgi:hypothetical protein|tara:strand:+ start:2784 stop:3083 length:300 start_codon:yes stop_codon:yes gene_type:complete